MKHIFTILAISTILSSSAQERWTMEQCMSYAATHASSVVQARWDVASAIATGKQALGDFFPSISAQVGSQFSWGRNIDPETNNYNDLSTFNNGYGIYASLTLFDGGQTLNRYKQARNERKRYLNAVEMKRDDSAISAMMAYADAYYYQHSIRIAEDKLRQSEGMLTLTKTQEELGIKGMPDVAQAEATVANDRYSLVHQRNLYDQAILTLKSSMNLPIEQPLAIDTAYMVSTSGMLGESAEQIYSTALSSNPKVLNARMQVTSSRYAYDITKGQLMPYLSVNAGISTSFFKNLSVVYSPQTFGEQFRNNMGEYISATLSIPIFDGLNRISSKKRAKYAYEKAKENLTEENRRLHDEISSAVMDRDGYAIEIESLGAKVKADAESYRLNSRKYEEGLMSLIDLQLSANTYFSSRLELLQKQMLYLLKDKLVEYYKGNKLWM
ncbi:MAG: TolC family protein [Muribaculaceae bacterium]|nr:TolC family protein [Muribaculaceae bacterium]